MLERISADLFGTAESGDTDPVMVIASIVALAATATLVATVS